jgi:hypothetical protein
LNSNHRSRETAEWLAKLKTAFDSASETMLGLIMDSQKRPGIELVISKSNVLLYYDLEEVP